jgi:hypothetical protein
VSEQEIDARVAGWLARVAEALEPVQSFDSSYGGFYVVGVSVGFEGYDTGIRLVPSDAESGFDIRIGPTPESASSTRSMS